MSITQENRIKLDVFLKNYFANNRTSSAYEIVTTLQEENAELFAILKESSEKMDEEVYLSRYILPKFKKEGWLALINDQWKVQLSPKRCSCCFKPIDQIYVIDIDLNRYCSWKCTEKCYYYAEPYESNLDMYSFLFDRFKILLPECLFYNKNTHFSHQEVLIKLEKTINEVESLIQDSYYHLIRRDKGKESCVDAEIYRMLTVLDQQYQRLSPLLIRATNIGACTQCHIALDESYIVSQYGDTFCSENCLEDYYEKQDTEYSPHPYEDQYLSIRREYIDLLENWEQRLSYKEDHLEAAVDEMYEEIDKIIDDYYDFIRSEGDDGVYAHEIYQYTNKLKDLQQKVFAWRPDREKYYWVSSIVGQYMSHDSRDKEMFDKVSKAIYLDGYGDELLEIIKKYPHPLYEGFNFVFDRYEDALEVYEVFKPYFVKYELELELRESYRCEAGCGDIVGNNNDNLFLNGFFYCYNHSESGDYGIYSKEELEKNLKDIYENDSERQKLIERDWCDSYKEKIKRSCRTYQIEIPDWAY